MSDKDTVYHVVSDEAVIAIIAGIAYCINNFPIRSVPSSVAVPALAIFFTFYLFNSEIRCKGTQKLSLREKIMYLCDEKK